MITRDTLLEAVIRRVAEVKARYNLGGVAVVYKLWTGKRCWNWGWNFQQGVEIGQTVEGEHGERFEIVAFV